MNPPSKENFLQRWSRLKRDPPTPSLETSQPPHPSAVVSPDAPSAPALPALDSLEFSSDFSAFMGDEVEDGLRRVALQKLFHAEHFNVMDGLDVYIDDYNSFEPIGEELLNNLNHARGLLFDEEDAAVNEVTSDDAGSCPAPELPDESPARHEISMDKKQ